MEKIYGKIQENMPGIGKIIRNFGHLTLGDYTDEFLINPGIPIQQRDDFIEVTGQYSHQLLGAETADNLERFFADNAVVLTANHHGVDYLSFTIQGSIIFALLKLGGAGKKAIPVVPVLACGTIPLDNYTYPMGITLSRKKPGGDKIKTSSGRQVRVTIIPWKYAQTPVSVAAPVQPEMVNKAVREVERLYRSGTILGSEKECLERILNEEYGRPEILELPDYSSQAVVLNSRLWRTLYAPEIRNEIPRLAYLEMEKVVSILLERDLGDKDSLFYNLIFDPSLRGKILQVLDKQAGCWDLKKLRALSSGSHPGKECKIRGCGTIFFWYVNRQGRRVPMAILEEGDPLKLAAINRDKVFQIRLTSEELICNLRRKRLLPSLFTSFSVLAFARGLKCYGGFYQLDYLPAMQKGLVQALESNGLYEWARRVASVPANNFITGMNAVLAVYPDHSVEPAGAVEIMAGGGLTERNLETIRSLSLKDANICGFLEAYRGLAGKNSLDSTSAREIDAEIITGLGEKMAYVQIS